MRLENDKVFNELFDEQFGNIPFVFRFSRRRFIATLAVMGLLLLAVVVFIVLFYHSGNYDENMGVNFYDNRYITGTIISAVLLALTALWVLVSRWYEQRAFIKANYLSSMIHQSEETRNRAIWNNWKAENRLDF